MLLKREKIETPWFMHKKDSKLSDYSIIGDVTTLW